MSELVSTRKRSRLKAQRGVVVNPPAHHLAIGDLAELVSVAKERREGGRPLAADLFSGCGGLSLGAEAAGFVPVLGIDHDPFALQTWGSLFPGLAANLDLGDPAVVTEVGSALKQIEIDLIVGGPPCQPFSRAGRSLMRHLVASGRRTEHDARRELWRSFLDVVIEAKPKIVLMENVPELALGDETILIRSIVDELEEEGYGVATRIVSTAEHGVPQHRKRAIVIALKGGFQYRWPERAGWSPTLRHAIGDLPAVEPGWNRLRSGEADQYEPRMTGSELTGWLRADLPPGDEGLIRDHVTRAVREDDLEIFRSMDSKTKYSDIDESLKRYRDDIFSDKYKRLDWDEPSRSITAHMSKDGYSFIHPEEHRTLTIREAARIQTFPDRVRFAGPPSASLRQIGNAVPPLAAYHLITSAVASLEEANTAVRTNEISKALAKCYTVEPRSVPWLDDKMTAWQVIQCEILAGQGDLAYTHSVHIALTRFLEPTDTLAEAAQLSALFELRNGSARLSTVLSAAEWFADRDPSYLRSSQTMAENPYVPLPTARLAALVSDADEAPILGSSGALRVAARFFDGGVNITNQNSEGRLAVARMIGGHVAEADTTWERRAHLRLLDLAVGVCTPSDPQCGECELRPWCKFASNRDS